MCKRDVATWFEALLSDDIFSSKNTWHHFLSNFPAFSKHAIFIKRFGLFLAFFIFWRFGPFWHCLWPYLDLATLLWNYPWPGDFHLLPSERRRRFPIRELQVRFVVWIRHCPGTRGRPCDPWQLSPGDHPGKCNENIFK